MQIKNVWIKIHFVYLIFEVRDTIDNKIAFICHLTVYFPQKRDFIDYSGYFMCEVAII